MMRPLLLLVAVACSPRAAPPGGEPLPSPDAASADSTLITLERTPCFGTCPVYRVTLSGEGRVAFTGTRFVSRVGTATADLPPERVDTLLRALEAGGYFGFADRYVPGEPPCARYATDLPSAITSVTARGRSKTIHHDHGCAGAPPELTRLERLIDETAGTARWTGR